MRLLDRRHKWGEPVEKGVYIERTCRVCGRTDRYERFLPDYVIDQFIENLTKPNPYRTIFL